jgi:hypothetical protein
LAVVDGLVCAVRFAAAFFIFTISFSIRGKALKLLGFTRAPPRASWRFSKGKRMKNALRRLPEWSRSSPLFVELRTLARVGGLGQFGRGVARTTEVGRL